MRTIVLALAGLLMASGLPLAFGAAATSAGLRKALALLHIWGGVLFLVVFGLYAWDHISANRRWLTRFAAVTFSGATQTLAALVLIATGVVLLLYGEQAWAVLRSVHHWLTYLLAASILFHFLSPKA